MSRTDPILELRDLEVHFDTFDGRARVINDVDITVDEGETVAIVGESGCGKSVTAETIMGMLPQPPGEIVDGELYYKGEELLGDQTAHERVKSESMGMIFQDPMTSLSPVFTVGEMMRDVLTYQGKTNVGWLEIVRNVLGRRDADEAEMRDRSVELLDQLQIPDPEGVLDRYPIELSGGMRQRVLIAMAMLGEPEFLIADEPTTALDVTVQDQILDLLTEQIERENLSMLYITHNLGVARRIADRIYVMYAGEIAEVGTRDEILDEPLHPYSRGLVDSVPKLTEFDRDGIEGLLPDYTDPPSGCRFHPRCPAAMSGTCDVERPPRYELSSGQEVACHLYEDGLSRAEAAEIAAEEIEFDSGAAFEDRPTSEPAQDRSSVKGESAGTTASIDAQTPRSAEDTDE
ncbi:ATP-binding cassette domain-containing protein [Natronorubrum sp. JWXQ-INN-674]|uniref:Nickel import system ATP-binding protein NikD n=1 Tax=Natronorubrum halalkaliphilum TaxID=2691917 RepID=A0A6B0VQY4_9EURY|nr:ABC transporter ATP-binding protein [Natronorubrum halalkaliphilum]MXV64050.1 ATP-binding cassette domain-containing protein [Natronorubrum halalkaliphilum]